MGKKSKRGKTKSKFNIRAVFDPDDEIGFVYSLDNSSGQPEFVALDVPRNKVEGVAGAMNFLAPREVKHGQNVQSTGLYFLTKLIDDRDKEDVMLARGLDINPKASLIQLVPQFEFDKLEDWGSRPPGPEGREDLVQEILNAWQNQKYFLLFIDGNTLNWSVCNLKRVDLAVSLRHVNDWKVDWDMDLTAAQVAFVRDHNRHFVELARVLFRRKEICAQCGVIEKETLNRCAGCRQACYCSVECQKKDWPNHKKECNWYKDMRNNKPSKERKNYTI